MHAHAPSRLGIVLFGLALSALGCGAGGGKGGGGFFGGILNGGGEDAAEDEGVPNEHGQGLDSLSYDHLQNAPMGGAILAGGTGKEQRFALSMINGFAKDRWQVNAGCPYSDLPKEATQGEVFDNLVKAYAAGCPMTVPQKLSDLEIALWEAPGTPMTPDEQNLSVFNCGRGQECVEMASHVKFGTYAKGAFALSDPGNRYWRWAAPVGVHSIFRVTKQDPHFAELMKEWEDKFYTPHKAEMDAAFKYIVAYERVKREEWKTKLPPCDADLQKAFFDYVASQKPTTRVEAEQIASDPVGAVLLRAAFACEIAKGDDVLASEDGFLLGSSRWLGKRSYAAIKIGLEKNQPDTYLWTGRTGTSWDNSFTGVDIEHRWGLVQKAEDKGNELLLTFKVVNLGTVYVTDNCWRTNRIESITSEGRIVYEEQCAGHEETVRGAEDPIRIPKALAANIAPGRVVRFKLVDKDKRLAFPMVVEDKDKKPVAAYGVPVEGKAPPKPAK